MDNLEDKSIINRYIEIYIHIHDITTASLYT